MNFNNSHKSSIDLAERVITCVARRRNSRCLRFSESGSLDIPHSTNANPTMLYLHVPFCEELCPYCSFHKVEFKEGLARDYFAALRKEVLMYKKFGYNFQALYIGGGTPTILMDELRSVIDLVRGTYDIQEISIETNPNHLTPDNIKALQAMSIHRLSVGVQTFNDGLLKSLNRYHKYGSGQSISEKLRQTQGAFPTLNIDMIFNFPGQTTGMLEADLASILDLGVDQVTFYPLMPSSTTQHRMNREFGGTTGGQEKAFYFQIVKALAAQYQASTAWCFSKCDSMIDEYTVNYEEFAGLGSGAIGYLSGSTYANTFDIPAYIEKINQGFLPISAKKTYTLHEKLSYDFMMKLFGLTLHVPPINAKHDVSMYRRLWLEIAFLRLVKAIQKQGDRLVLTPKGQYYWSILMREFFISVNNFRDHCSAQTKHRPPSLPLPLDPLALARKTSTPA